MADNQENLSVILETATMEAHRNPDVAAVLPFSGE